MIHIHRSWPVAALMAAVAAGTLTFAQPSPDAQPSDPMGEHAFLTDQQREHLRSRFQHRRGRMELRHQRLELVDGVYELSMDPARAAILHMQRIERLYREQGDRDGLTTFYREILDRTDNLAIRNVAWLKLSEMTARSKDIEGALSLLELGLEENLRQAD